MNNIGIWDERPEDRAVQREYERNSQQWCDKYVDQSEWLRQENLFLRAEIERLRKLVDSVNASRLDVQA